MWNGRKCSTKRLSLPLPRSQSAGAHNPLILRTPVQAELTAALPALERRQLSLIEEDEEDEESEEEDSECDSDSDEGRDKMPLDILSTASSPPPLSGAPDWKSSSADENRSGPATVWTFRVAKHAKHGQACPQAC